MYETIKTPVKILYMYEKAKTPVKINCPLMELLSLCMKKNQNVRKDKVREPINGTNFAFILDGIFLLRRSLKTQTKAPLSGAIYARWGF